MKRVLLLMGLTALMVAPVHAQSIGIGPQVGYYRVQDADEGNFTGGVAVRAKLIPFFGIEASLGYRQEKYADDLLTVHSWPVMVTGLIYPLPMIYGAMGFGWYNTTFDYDQDRLPLLEDDTAQKVGWHFGGGVELPIGASVKLTADIRYVFLDYEFEDVPGSGDMSSNFYVVTAGLLFGL